MSDFQGLLRNPFTGEEILQGEDRKEAQDAYKVLEQTKQDLKKAFSYSDMQSLDAVLLYN